MKKYKILKILFMGVCSMFLVSGSAFSQNDNCGDAIRAEQPLYASSPDWVAKLGEKKKATQLFVVAGVGKTTAYVSMHEKTADGSWRQIISTPGYIGKQGLGKTREGDGKTPVGTFRFNAAFGIADDPGCRNYPDLNKADSEHLIDYLFPYQYAMNISYNEDGTPGRGSAIFLHCLGDQRPYTGGCVAIPRNHMITVLRNVKKDCVVVIDSLKNISPETFKKWGL